MPACRRHYPGRTERTYSLVLSSRLRPSPTNWRVSSCVKLFRALLSVHSRYSLQTRGVATCNPFHRRLLRLRYLHRRSDCYRVERTSSQAGLPGHSGGKDLTAKAWLVWELETVGGPGGVRSRYSGTIRSLPALSDGQLYARVVFARFEQPLLLLHIPGMPVRGAAQHVKKYS
jgi:hypothetical protein